MLDAVGQQAVGLQLVGLAVAIQRLEVHAQGAGDLGIVLGDRQAPLLHRLALLADRGDLGVDQHQGAGAVVADVHDDHPTVHVDLGRRQADAAGVVHGLQHVVDQPADLVIDLRHGRRPGAQALVGILEDG